MIKLNEDKDQLEKVFFNKLNVELASIGVFDTLLEDVTVKFNTEDEDNYNYVEISYQVFYKEDLFNGASVLITKTRDEAINALVRYAVNDVDQIVEEVADYTAELTAELIL